MGINKKIAIISGGLSSEREVSLKTGEAFAAAVTELGYSFEIIDAGIDLPVKLFELKPEIALLALHGKYAEDGTVQGICEYLKIPYTGSGVLGSALAMNKTLAKGIFNDNGIPTPKGFTLDYRELNIDGDPEEKKKNVLKKISGPYVVKPSRDGSSMGITICQTESLNYKQFDRAIELAAKYDDLILIEEYIPGKEVTVPILDNQTLTSIEIEPIDGYYDYKNKYTEGKTNYYLPARLSEEVSKVVSSLALKSFKAINARSYGRVDFRITPEGRPYVLEVNTLPGCTETSLVPRSALKDGISFADFIKKIVELATLDYNELS